MRDGVFLANGSVLEPFYNSLGLGVLLHFDESVRSFDDAAFLALEFLVRKMEHFVQCYSNELVSMEFFMWSDMSLRSIFFPC